MSTISDSDRTADDWRLSQTTGLGVVYGQWSRTGSNRRPLACHNPGHTIQDALTTLYRGLEYCKRCKHSAALREFVSGCAVYTALRETPGHRVTFFPGHFLPISATTATQRRCSFGLATARGQVNRIGNKRTRIFRVFHMFRRDVIPMRPVSPAAWKVTLA